MNPISHYFIIFVRSVTIVILFVTFHYFFTIDNDNNNISSKYVLYEEAAEQALYKLTEDNMDGSIDVIFNIPETSELAKRLKNDTVIKHYKLIDNRPFVETFSTRESKNIQTVTLNKNEKGAKEMDKPKKFQTSISNHIKKTSYPLTTESKYLINNPNICQIDRKLNFLVIVHTATNHFDRRKAIRQTWANKNIFKNGGLRIAFMLGLTKDNKIQALINDENIVHGDIIQGDFLDSYHNLTHKGVLAYRWITEYCTNAEMIVKVDDDMFVNIFSLLDYYLPLFRTKSKFFMCQLRQKGTSIIQRQSGKWKVMSDEFKNMTHFPVDYCNGFFVLMTPDMIRGLYKASYFTPFFWVDDVYLYGLLPSQIGGVTYKHFGRNVSLNENYGLKCFTGNVTCNLAGTAVYTKGTMEKLWYASLKMFRGIAKSYVSPEILNA